ncbi:MAG: FHA domain-containing protein [Fuerstiella sp.]|nr:FHA domain-containing protein [Fuerstiella sp.]
MSIIECSGTEQMLGELNPCGGGDTIPLLHEKILIGRRSSCDICLALSNVSSHHCELELQKHYWHVRDLGSTNGVKVNGERTLESVLMPGDELQVAKSRFRIEYCIHPDAAAPESIDTFALSLMQKAGLEKPADFRIPQSSDERRARMKAKRRSENRDDFIMDWLSDEEE